MCNMSNYETAINFFCVFTGVRFARQQVKAGLAWLLRRFTLGAQVYAPKHFEPSFFALRDPDARYEFIPRNHAQKS